MSGIGMDHERALSLTNGVTAPHRSPAEHPCGGEVGESRKRMDMLFPSEPLR
jgi:hypothetical protein